MSTSALVAANIRAEMARKGSSQRALAAALEMSPTAISKRLSGRTPIDLDELGKIAQFLDMPAERLLATDAA